MLLAWFSAYVLFDVVSTFWLINNTVIGLAGELNPLGRAIFAHGFMEAYFAKLVGFIPVSAATIFLDANYGRTKWVREVTETVLLGLICVSLLAALTNYDSILVTYVQWVYQATGHFR